MEAKGHSTPVAKLRHAMRVVAPPVLLGAASTFLGVLPLAFSRTLYVKNYFFVAFSVMVGIGVVNALVFLPAKLMAMSAVGQAAARALLPCRRKAAAGRAPPHATDSVDVKLEPVV